MGTVVALKPTHAIVGDDFWTDISTGDWATDCLAGRNRAERVAYRFENHLYASAAFTRMMRDLVDKGNMTGVEIGFFQRMLELTVTGWAASK